MWTASTCRVCNLRPLFSLYHRQNIPIFFSESHNKTHQVTLGLGASDRRSICSSGTSCVASSVIVSVAVAAAPAFAAPPPPPPPPEEEAAPAAAGGCPLGGAEARSVRDVTDPCRPWPALLLLPLPSILVGVDEVRLCFVLMHEQENCKINGWKSEDEDLSGDYGVMCEPSTALAPASHPLASLRE